LIASLQWRKDFKPETITENDIKTELACGKLFWLPTKDKKGRDVLLFFGGLHFPAHRNLEEFQKYVVYTIEKKRNETPPGSDWQYVLIQDRMGAGKSNYDKEATKTIFGMLAQNYPETISEILFINVNWVFWMFFHVVKLFIDPRTAQKIRILGNNTKQELLQYFEEDTLWQFYGGKFKWDYQVTAYYKLAGIQEPEPSPEEAKEAQQLQKKEIDEMD